jgi:RHS repeat-associated protein
LGSDDKPLEVVKLTLAASPASIVAVLKTRPNSPVSPGMAIGFDAVSGGGLKPRFAVGDIAAESAPARMTLPGTAAMAMHLEDAGGNTAVDVSLRSASAAAAQQADGDLVYAGALASGGTVVHRPMPAGTEDFVAFDTKPSTTQLTYNLKLGAGAAGLRLIGGTLEVLDPGGTPRVRVAPPYIVGADGVSTDATLAVSGCAVDADPSPPWGRAVTAPGSNSCQVTVTWPQTGIAYQAILDPRWTTTGSMGTARQEHTALLLSTGKVLVAGGRSSSSGTTGLTTAELYDRTTGTWAATGSMTAGRRLHTMTQLNTGSNSTTSGKVLVAGGIDGSTSLNTAQLYNPSTGTWAAATNLNAARHLHTGTLLPDGRVLVAGGMNGTATLQTAAVYNPASGSGSWSATTGPIPPPGWRFGTATLIQTTNAQLNNRVLLVGGNNGTSSISAVFLFDPAQNAFSTLASISAPREQHTAVVLPNTNGKILVTGGKNGPAVLATALVFDPGFSNGSWSSAGTMTSARFGHSATVLPTSIVANGTVLVAGGNNGSGALTSVELLSGTSTWTATPSMPSPPSQGHTATLLGNSMILVAGGLNGSTVLSNARLYDASFGLGCTSPSQCTTGNCVNGVCCDTTCTDQCHACNMAGSLGVCSPKTNGSACTDGNACTLTDTCQSGTCVGGNLRTCQAWDQCHAPGTCDSTTGRCTTPAVANGTSCNDGNSCTQGDVCSAGVCAGSVTCNNPVFATTIDLGALWSSDGNVPAGLNASGDVVGTESDAATGWSAAWRFTDATHEQAIAIVPSTGVSQGAGINDASTVVGSLSSTIGGSTFGFSAALAAGSTNITASGGSAAGINNAGQIAATEPKSGLLSAFRLTGSTKVYVGTPTTGIHLTGATVARGIGPGGQVVGEALSSDAFRDYPDGTHFAPTGGVREAFIYVDGGGIRNLNSDPVVSASSWQLLYTATATNGTQVVGWGLIGGLRHAYRYTIGVKIVDLGPFVDDPAMAGADVSGIYSADAINGSGAVVGTVHNPGSVRAFYYDDANGILDLNDLVDPALRLTLVSASGINAQYEIVGSYLLDGDPRPHAYRMQLPPAVFAASGPVAKVVPRIDGVCNLGGGQFMAVFGYDSTANVNENLAYGTVDNVFVVNDVVKADPSPAPPVWFLPGSHPAAFTPTFASSETVTWTVAGKEVSASASSTPLTCGSSSPGGPGLDFGAVIGGQFVTIRPDPWSHTGTIVFPDLIAGGTPAGGTTAGTLDGHLAVSTDGAATYHVPIWVPRAPLQPTLALDYNSRNESSFTGVGFQLGGLGEISRCKAAYAQDPPLRPESSVNFTNTDHLCLNGRILISTAGTPWSDLAEFRPDDDPYTRVRQHVSSSSVYFEVFRRDGTIETYGQTQDSIVAAGTSGTPQLSWGLNKRADRTTNIVSYKYQFPSPATDGVLRERLPDRITFGSTEGSASPPYSVVFKYQATLDERTAYVSGYRSDSTQLLSEIQVFGPSPEGSGVPFGRDYRIVYNTPTITKRALISSIQECDRPAGSASQVTCKPPTTFSWEPGKLEFQDVTQSFDGEIASFVQHGPPPRDNTAPIGNVEGRYFYLTTGDVNKDGLDDLIYRGIGGGFDPQHPGSPGEVVVYYRLSNGTGFGAPHVIPGSQIVPANDPPTLQQPSIPFKEQLVTDFDLDGAADVKIHNGVMYSVFKDSAIPAGDAVADLDGDGLPDYLKGATFWSYYYVAGAPVIGNSIFVEFNRMTVANAPLAFNQLLPAGIGVDDNGIALTQFDYHSAGFGPNQPLFPPLVDLNGDGAIDMVLDAGRAIGTIGTGRSNFQLPPTGLPTPGVNPALFAKSMIFADVNGDGLPDAFLFRVPTSGTFDNVTVSINSGFNATGGGFTTPVALASGTFDLATWLRDIDREDCLQYLPQQNACPGPNDQDQNVVVSADPGLRIGDFDGDGRQDILSFTAPGATLNGIYDPVDNHPAYGTFSVQIFPGTNQGLGAPILVTTDQNQNPTNSAPAVRAGGNTHGQQPPHAFNRVLDVNGDGLPDFVSNQDGVSSNVPAIHLYIHEGKKPDLLLSATNGLGATDSIEYDHLGNPASGIYIPHALDGCVYPQYCVNKGVWVVSKIHRDTGGVPDGTPTLDVKFTYEDARTDVQGLGWLGFALVVSTNVATGEQVTTFYDDAFKRVTINGSSSYPEALLPTTETHRWFLDNGTVIEHTRTDTYSVGQSGEVLLTSSVTREFEGAVAAPQPKTKRTLLLSQYDAQGNAQHETEELEQVDSVRAPLREIWLRTTDRTFDNDLTGWLLGLVRTEQTELQTFGDGAEDIVRHVSWDYAPGTNLVAHEIREPTGASDVNLTATFNRNARGLVTRVTRQDLLGNKRVTDIGYDPIVGHFADTITEDGLTATQFHDPTFGTVSRATDPNGTGTTFVYDTFGRRKKATPDLSGSTVWVYSALTDGSGALAIDQDTDGAPARRTVFDRLGRTRVSEEQRFGSGEGFAGVQTDYDAVGRVARVSVPSAPSLLPTLASWNFTNYSYDKANRLSTVIYPAEGVDATGTPLPSGELIRTYDWLSTTDSRFDKVGDTSAQLIRSFTRDARGEVSSSAQIDPSSGRAVTTSFIYGAAGLMTRVTTPGSVTSVDYDAWGRRAHLADPDTGTTQTSYNAFDDIVQDVTPRGTTNHGRDNLGRWTGDNGPDGVTTLVWDVAASGLGKPATATSPDAVELDWTYDGASRLRTTTWVVPGEASPFTMEQDRDDLGRLSSVVYPNSGAYSLKAVYGYSPTGYLASVVRQENGGASVPLWTVDQRAVDGQVRHEVYGDGTDAVQTETTRGYTFTGRLSSLFTKVTGATTGLQDATYGYDGLGRIVSRTADTFQYDFFSRLNVWNHANSAWTETYEYDDIGNLRHHTGAGASGLELTETFTFDQSGGAGPHAITAGPDGPYLYDDIGNQRSAPGRTAVFWEFGLPKQVTTNNVETTFQYDAFRSRVVKANNQGSRTVSLGGLYEKRLDNGQTAYAFYVAAEGRVVAQLTVDALGNRHTEELHGDNIGSTVLVTDEIGTASTIDFDPWGKKVTYDPNGHPVGANMSAPGIRVGFTGHDQDDELGLVNMLGRLYDPSQRRFISPDPFVQSPFNGQSHNRYAYVLNDPLNLIDPSGFEGEGDGDDVPKAVGASPGMTACCVHRGGESESKKSGTKGAKGTGAAPGAYDAMLAQDTSLGINGSKSGNPAGSPTGDPNGRATNNPGTSQGAGATGGPANAPDGVVSNSEGSPTGSTSGSLNDPRVGSPTGSRAPNAAPNGIENPKLDWFGRAWQSALPNTTMNPDTKLVLFAASILIPIVIELAPLADAMALDDGLIVADEDLAEDVVTEEEELGHPTFRPGPFAGESIPARSSSQKFTPEERAAIDRIGSETGCHTCGNTNPGTKGGHFVPDHQPVSRLNVRNAPQRLYPHCLGCSRDQGLATIRALRGQK